MGMNSALSLVVMSRVVSVVGCRLVRRLGRMHLSEGNSDDELAQVGHRAPPGPDSSVKPSRARTKNFCVFLVVIGFDLLWQCFAVRAKGPCVGKTADLLVGVETSARAAISPLTHLAIPGHATSPGPRP